MIVKRTTEVKCDATPCSVTVTIKHDLVLECDAGYAFNEALARAGWGDLWLNNAEGYGHLCPECLGKRRRAATTARQRRDAKLAKRRGHA